jgi:hypothetical protein
MKKKKISLQKKLVLHKSVVADLNKQEQSQMVGGAAVTQACATRFLTCETYVAPTRCVKCPD